MVGTGLDQIYPRRNRKLGERIAAEGPIVSEYPLGMPPLANNSGCRAVPSRTGLTAVALSVWLLDLGWSGDAARLPGQLFQRLIRG